MGRADNPVIGVYKYASDHFAIHLPIIYVQRLSLMGQMVS